MVSIFLLLYACDDASMLVGTVITARKVLRRYCMDFSLNLLKTRAIAR
jgi:hypothetical protein